MNKPMPGTEIIREGWFYLDTYHEGEYGDAHRRPEDRSPKCTLLIRRAQLRRGPSGRVRAVIDTDAIEFEDKDAMLAWIEEHDATELPAEADGNPQYVPEGFRPEDIRALSHDR
jgi:hypothetical protein